MNSLEIKNVSSQVGGKTILSDVSLDVKQNEVVVILGPNGAGKSSIAQAIIGNPTYEITSGSIILDGENITDLPVEERAKKGIFLSFQQPQEISGITMANFLRSSYNSVKGTSFNLAQFHKLLKEKMQILEMDPSFRTREVNKGFSGGEKKRSELLQLLLFEPKFAILDEIDSGLDVDALRKLSSVIAKAKEETKAGFIIITHHTALLDVIEPDKVIVIKKGQIVEQGDKSLVEKIQKEGFNS